MKSRKIIAIMVAVVALTAGGYSLYWLGMTQGMSMVASSGTADRPEMERSGQGTSGGPENGKKILYWHDPMVPGHKFDKPGKSPFMDMQLVPVYADETGDNETVSISPRVQQNLGIRTAEVTKGNAALAVEAVGNVVYNERDVALVQARSNGFVERLSVRAPLDPVKKGQPLAQLYVPDWIAAQEEYLVARQMGGIAAGGLADAAKQRMRLVGMTDDLIRQVEFSGKVQPRLTIVAPVSGVVSELVVREGMTVMAGAPMFRINGLNTIWVIADIPENMSAQVRPGNTVEARTPSLPGTLFKGKVNAILPEINAATRTIKARVELANPGAQLVPGMFATVGFMPASREALLVPTEAVIQTGTRSVVIVSEEDGRFSTVDVETGMEVRGQTEIRKGLQAGQKVVVSGQFLIDSEASLRGTTTRMGEASAGGASKAAKPLHRGQGKVESIDKEEITLSHGPMPSLQWGEMTMPFKLPPGGLPSNIAEGDTVTFEIREAEDGMFEITSIEPLSKSAAQPAKGNNKPGVSK